jgi:diguanylate cyclase (GGDEF)-like protein
MNASVLGRLAAFVDTLPRAVVLAACVALMAIVGAADLLTSAAVVLPIFYAVPIALASWTIGRAAGVAFAAIATSLWTIGDVYGLDQAWSEPVVWWNFGMRLAFFVVVVFILVALKDALDEEQRLARLDSLTRLPNVRQFRERAELELSRARRTGKALSVAIFDVDNLKAVNDGQGHAAGDALLVAVARAWSRALRTTDMVARLGGDEFAVLLPDTDAAAARIAVQKGRGAALTAIAEGGWQSSLSLGMVTCADGAADVERLLRGADQLMYEVKGAGKDGVRVGMLEDGPASASGSARPGTGRMQST